MSVQTTVSRPAGTSVGAAAIGLVATLALFVVTVLAFLIAPLVLFAVALVAYLILRPRNVRFPQSAPPAQPGGVPHDFGVGTS